MALADKHPKLKQFREGRIIQKKTALELCKKANILPGAAGLRKILKIQGALMSYQIIVIDYDARNSVILEGPRRDKKIVIYKHGDHYNVTNPNRLPTFHSKRFDCQKCKSYYNDYFAHPCSNPCRTCLRKNCVEISSEKSTCSDCFKMS